MVYAYILELIRVRFKGEESDRLIEELAHYKNFEELKKYINNEDKPFMKWVNGW